MMTKTCDETKEPQRRVGGREEEWRERASEEKMSARKTLTAHLHLRVERGFEPFAHQLHLALDSIDPRAE